MPSTRASAAGPLADRLALAAREAHDGSLDLLDHSPDTGDRSTDAAVNELVEHAADLLRAASAALSEHADRVAAIAGPGAGGPGQEANPDLPTRGRRPASRADRGFGSLR